MVKYIINGMTCASCSTRVENAVSKLDNVTKCSVNLLTKTMLVEGTATFEEISKAVEKAGYEVKNENTSDFSKKNRSESLDNDIIILNKRLIYSLIFLIGILYFSMGQTMFSLSLPSFFNNNHIAVALIQMLFTIIVIFINKNFFVKGTKNLINKAPSMDTLIALGSGSAFIYSVVMVFLMTKYPDKSELYLHDLYFESSAMILTLITVGKLLEERAKGKTTNAIKGLIDLTPKTALILKDGIETIISADKIKKDDIFIVKSGTSIPADGIIIDGNCSVDESSLTGESIPVDKVKGDYVSQATINKSGYVKCRATNVGKDTVFSQIIKLVTDSSATKPKIANVADKVSGIFVPIVIIIALVTTVVWALLGESFGFSLARGISVLVISCPCALGLATPVAIIVANGVGARHGILFKNAISIEEVGKVKIAALDKTGTITTGIPRVTEIVPADGTSEESLLTLSYSLEIKSEHPLAKAIKEKCFESSISPLPSEEVKIYPGNGIEAKILDDSVYGGNYTFVSKFIEISSKYKNIADKLSIEGKTPLFFAKNNSFIGIIAVSDSIRSDSKDAILKLKKFGIKTVMITGDNSNVAKSIKNLSGVDEFYADVLPSEKERIINDLKKQGKTLMVGDGINDAPALTSADIGIAVSSGTDIAIDSAGIILMQNSLNGILTTIKLSKKTLKIIYQNLFWAFIYNCLGIPIAAGVFIPAFGITLNPMLGALFMSLSSFCVVTNALRINLFKPNNLTKQKKESKIMQKILMIDGMSCPHCEARVKKCLEDFSGVKCADVSFEKKSAIVTLEKEISNEELKIIVENQGYKVIEIK